MVSKTDAYTRGDSNKWWNATEDEKTQYSLARIVSVLFSMEVGQDRSKICDSGHLGFPYGTDA